jgi:hypothetical protein
MIKIAIMHIPRELETIDRSLRSMKDGFRGELFIAPDGDCDVASITKKMGVRSIFNKDRVGCFRHYARTLKWLIKNTQDGDILAVLPDDLIYLPFEKAITQALKSDKVGYCAIYTPREMGRRNNWKFGGWQVVTGGYGESYGGGYFFKREVAKQVIQHDFFVNHLNNYEKNQQIDHAVPEVIHQMGLKQLWHVPSLSKHIGVTSTIGHEHTEAEEAWGWRT